MTDLFRIPYNVIRPIYERTSFHRSVVEEVEDRALKEAYIYCREMTRHHAKTFYMATRFLPNRKQRGIFAIYALCRYMDDLVDEAEGGEKLKKREVLKELAKWKEKLQLTFEGKTHDNPILMAFSDVLRSYPIPMKLPFELMEGVSMDLYKRRYQTFGELYEYSYKVASTVGLMTSEIFGYRSDEAKGHAVELGIAMQFHAVELGIAMQLTNILRDVGEDLEKERIYIPLEDLDRFGVSESDLFEHRMDGCFKELIRFQIERARAYYERSSNGIDLLRKDSRLPVQLARTNYCRILDKIEQNDYDVFGQRAYLNATEKLTALPGILYRTMGRGHY